MASAWPSTASTSREPLWSEQDPALWWSGAQQAIPAALQAAGATGADVAAVGLTGQMHGLVLLDASDEVLRPAILWNDQRTAAECLAIRDAVGPERLIEITGNDALTGFTAPKLVWVRDHEPETWARVAHVLLPKDYLRLRLTGEHAMDKADGAGTLLFDLAARNWSPEVVAALRIDPAWLPPTYEGPEQTGVVTAEAAAATGLVAGTPVVAGGGDQSANGVGVGVVSPGTMALSLGTSGVVFAATDRPLYEPRGRVHAFCHAVPERWHMMSVMLSAAGSLRWFRDALAPGEDFGALVNDAAEIPAGSNGLVFLPYLSGERSPHPDPLARGAFIGLTLSHDRRHMTRAVLEGVAYGLRDGLELMLAAGTPLPTQIRASGGGLVSPVWRQILADVLDAEIAAPSTSEGAAYGAAVLAAVGVGWYSSVDEACDAMVSATPVAQPGAGRVGLPGRLRDLSLSLPHPRRLVPPPRGGLATGSFSRAEDLDCAGLDRDRPFGAVVADHLVVDPHRHSVNGELDASAAVGHQRGQLDLVLGQSLIDVVDQRFGIVRSNEHHVEEPIAGVRVVRDGDARSNVADVHRLDRDVVTGAIMPIDLHAPRRRRGVLQLPTQVDQRHGRSRCRRAIPRDQPPPTPRPSSGRRARRRRSRRMEGSCPLRTRCRRRRVGVDRGASR